MKLHKEIDENGGYYITVVMGKNEERSYWPSLPIYDEDNSNSCNFEKECLIERYNMINTKAKAETFIRLYKNLWIEVTPCQLELMEHCIGLGRMKKPYRNHYFTQKNDSDWNELTKKGLAKISSKHQSNNDYSYFSLSKQGVEFLLGKSVSDKYYNEL